MKLFGKKDEKDEILEQEYEDRLNTLYAYDVASAEYGQALDNVMKLKNLVKDDKLFDASKLNPNTIISCGTTIACVVGMMVFEYVGHGSFSTKAFGFVPKPKV